MENDVVKILTSEVEENGIPKGTVEISDKPQYMLKEEYNEHLISCAVNTVKEIVKAIYPDNAKAQENCIKGIMNRVLFR